MLSAPRDRAASILDRPFALLERLLAHNAAWAAGITLVAALQLALILTHIPWLDETQALLIATEPQRLSDMFAILHYEGHPFLWYLLLRGLASVLPLGWVLKAACLLCAATIQGIILARAPFSRAERLLLSLNEIILFEYGTLSRGLGLGVALVLVAMVLWRTRAVWLAIALLPTCEFLFGVLSLGFIAMLWRERRLWPAGVGLWAVCSIAAAVSIFPAADVQPALVPSSPLAELPGFVDRVGTIALPFKTTFIGIPAWNGTAPFGIGLLLAPLLLIWILRRTEHSPIERRFFLGFFLLCLLLSVSVYPLHFRYVSLVGLLLLALAWRDPGAFRDVWWCRGLIVGAFCGLATSVVAFAEPFDAAPQTAAIINKLDDGRRPLLAYQANPIAPLYALTGKRFVQPEQGCRQGLVLWNHRSPIRKPRQFNRALASWAKVYGQSILVIEEVPRNFSPAVFKPLTRKLRGYDRQTYIIGILGPGEPVRQRIFPACQASPRAKTGA